MKGVQADSEIMMLKELAKKAQDSRIRVRYDVIRLSLQGRTRSEIAEIFGIGYQTVRNYINSYTERGVDGLIGKSSGRKTKLTKEQEQQLYDCIATKLPRDVGFAPFANWTASLAQQWVEKEFGIVFSERGMRDVFYRLKLKYSRTAYNLKRTATMKK